MKPDEADGAGDAEATTRAVDAFLRANPSWLAERPELYRVLAPPARVHGEGLADHMTAMLRAERAHAAAMSGEAERVLAAGRAAAGLLERVQRAVLALIRTTDVAECVGAELPALLGVDAAGLCAEPAPAGPGEAGLRGLPRGAVGRLLGSRDVVVRAAPADARALHGEAALLARHDALVRVPRPGAPCLLALVSREAALLEPGRALVFLGEAVAAAMDRVGR